MWCIGKLTEEYRQRMYDLLDLYGRPFRAREPVICVDEKSKQLLRDSRPPLPLKPCVPVKQDYEYVRVGTCNLFVAVEPKGGRSGDANVRERPPYTPEFEKIYLQNIEKIAQGRLPDPVNTCGRPHGFPRSMNLPDVYEFAVRPEQTWIIGENGPNVIRV